jgi:N-acetylmuramoyl-L-alanine amidase
MKNKILFIAMFSLLVLFLENRFCFAEKNKSLPFKKVNAVVDGNYFPEINLYKVGNKTNYFSIKELSKIYKASLEWKSVSSVLVFHSNNKEISIKINSPNVVFNGVKKNLDLPTILEKGDLFVPPQLVTSKHFADVVLADTSWNPEKLILNVNSRSNILAVRYFIRQDKTQVLIELDRHLSYSAEKSNGAIVITIFGTHVRHDIIAANNEIIKYISLDNDRRNAVIKINLQQTPKSVKVSRGSDLNKISVDIIHSQNIELKEGNNFSTKKSYTSLLSNVVDERKDGDEEEEYEDDIDDIENAISEPIENLGEAKPIEVIEIVEDENNADDIKKRKPIKYEATNIVSDDYILIDENIKNSSNSDISYSEISKKKLKKEKRVIVLDAGHGGTDPGAIGPSGSREKDINLAIVKKLKEIFDSDGDFNVILTRNSDVFIPLAERTDMANKQKADLFISVHCNANFNRNIGGFEIYFLSDKATDSEAAATATFENSVIELEGKPTKQLAMLQEMLWSMAANEFLNESSELCGFISSQTFGRLKIKNNGIKQANFFVLRGTQMPSVLIESAFISNYAEESNLNLNRFQTAIADSIYEGVIKFYERKEKLVKK